MHSAMGMDADGALDPPPRSRRPKYRKIVQSAEKGSLVSHGDSRESDRDDLGMEAKGFRVLSVMLASSIRQTFLISLS